MVKCTLTCLLSIYLKCCSVRACACVCMYVCVSERMRENLSLCEQMELKGHLNKVACVIRCNLCSVIYGILIWDCR